MSVPLRLSSWVFFVEQGREIDVHNALSGLHWSVPRKVAGTLWAHAGFRSPATSLALWVDRGVLVEPFGDPLGPAAGVGGVEADLTGRWTDWYWAREVEAEREYRWLGEVVLKMPEDLFAYQELFDLVGASRVLEIGHARGGGLWYFASVLAMRDGGRVVGIDRVPFQPLPDFRRFPTVEVTCVYADAHLGHTVRKVASISPTWDVIVIDADPHPDGKLDLLERWAPLVAPGGLIVVEDLGSPECREVAAHVARRLDSFLLQHRDFGVVPQLRRFPLTKIARGAMRRTSWLDAGAPLE